MAENINLIPASDLPITEAKEVDVLCVENGELKRKAGATLGGGSKGYILAIDTENDTMEDSDEGTTVTIARSYDEFAGVLYEGGTVWVDMTPMFGSLMRIHISAWVYMDGALQMISSIPGGGQVTFICTNGTWTPPEV